MDTTKKLLLFALVLVCVVNTATAETVRLNPQLEEYWTGLIRESLNDPPYGYFGSDIMAGGTFLMYTYRGYARFDLEDLPAGATIQQVELWFSVSTASDDNQHDLVITELGAEPGEASAGDAWGSMETWYVDDPLDAMQEQGAHTIELNQEAIESLQGANDDGEDWWGVGFIEEDDGSLTGTILGYTSRSHPYLSVTYGEQPIPDEPTDVVAEYQPPETMALTWTDNSDNESLFQVQGRYSPPDGDWTDWEDLDEVDADVTEWEETVDSDGTCQYRVRAVLVVDDDTLASDWAESNEEQVLLPPVEVTGLAAVYNPPDTITVSWTDECENEEGFHFEVRHRPLDGDWGDYQALDDLPENAESAEYISEEPGDYRFRVATYNATGASDWVESNSVFVPPVPQPVSDFAGEYYPDELEIRLTWTDNADYEDRFILEYRPENLPGWEELAELEPDAASYTHEGIDQVGLHYYRICSENDAGRSEWVETEVRVEIDDLGDRESSGLPRETRLDDAYPNPFNGQTTVLFRLHRTNPVSIRVYDLNGRETGVFLNGEVRRPGYHGIPLNLDHLPSGIYFLRMEAGDYRAIRKLVLVR